MRREGNERGRREGSGEDRRVRREGKGGRVGGERRKCMCVRAVTSKCVWEGE